MQGEGPGLSIASEAFANSGFYPRAFWQSTVSMIDTARIEGSI
jgi:hypothetical protein